MILLSVASTLLWCTARILVADPQTDRLTANDEEDCDANLGARLGM